MLEFCIRSITDGCDYFLRTAQNELTMNEKMNKEAKSKMEEHVKELKEELSTAKASLENKVRDLQSEKAHLEAKEQIL